MNSSQTVCRRRPTEKSLKRGQNLREFEDKETKGKKSCCNALNVHLILRFYFNFYAKTQQKLNNDKDT